MTPISGHEGTVTIEPAGSNVELEGVTQWSANFTTRLADSTHGGTGGIEHYTAIVTGGTVQIEFLWDAVKLPDTDLSIGTGDDFVAKLKCGTTDKFYQFLVITESFSVIDNETSDVIRCSLTGRINGVVTPPVT